MSAFVEIARFHHAPPLETCTKTLEDAGIPFRLSNDSLTANVAATQIGSNASCIVTVAADQVIAAHQALLEAARQEVVAGLDPDHYLHSCDNEALLDTIRNPSEWGEYDLAVAEKLLKDRGMPAPEISFHPPAPQTECAALPAASIHDEPLPGSRRGSRLVLAYGFFFGTFGGLIGMVIGWNYALATETPVTDRRKHYVFDEATRRLGTILLFYSVIVFFALLAYVLNRNVAR